MWATSRSIQFWTFCVHNQPTLRQWHVYLASQCVMCPQWVLWDHHTSTSCTSSHSGRSGSPVSLGSHYMNHIKIQDQSIFRRFMSPMSPRSHFISMSYTSSRSMHYVSPLSLGSHQASTPFTFSYFGHSKSPVSHRGHYLNRIKIYPFSDILCPQRAKGAAFYQCHVLLAVQCAMCPHWALGPTYFINLYV